MTAARIAFLFGSGAEGNKENFNIRTGVEYKNSTLLLQKNENSETYFSGALSKFFESRKDLDKSFYKYSAKSSTLTTARDLYKKILKNYLSVKFGDREADNIMSNKAVENEFKQLLLNVSLTSKKTKYKNLRKVLNRIDKSKSIIDFVDEIFEIGYGGILDSYFYTIIDPKRLGNNKFSIIFNFYWACYFCIAEDIIKYFWNKGIIEISTFILNGKINCSKVLNEFPKFTRLLYQLIKEDENDESYYHFITKHLENNSDSFSCSGIITTNYSNFVEQIPAKYYSYPNGKIYCFEFPELLEVRNFMTEGYSKKELFFPFMFGQSHVKPIVNKLQIEEFSKMQSILNTSDYLIVLGQSFSVDDNHINAFIHSFVKDGKKLVVVTNKNEAQEKGGLKQKLKLGKKDESKLIIVSVDYSIGTKKIVNEIFKQIKA